MCFEIHRPSLCLIRSKRLGAPPFMFEARRRKGESLLSPNSSSHLTPVASIRISFERRLAAALVSFALAGLFACLTCSLVYGCVGVGLDVLFGTRRCKITGFGHSA